MTTATEGTFDYSFTVTIPAYGRPGEREEHLLEVLKRHVQLSISKQATVGPVRDWVADVRKFHEVFDAPIGEKPHLLDAKLQANRQKFLKEEMTELRDAIAAGDLVEQADALIDIIYFAIGEMICAGIPAHEVWDEVQRSNMAKRNADGSVSRDPKTRKVLKPTGWKPPDVAKVLRAAGWRKPRAKKVAQ